MPMPKSHARIAADLRAEATYSTGKPCRRGHVAPRRISNYVCTECERVHLDRQREKYQARKRC